MIGLTFEDFLDKMPEASFGRNKKSTTFWLL